MLKTLGSTESSKRLGKSRVRIGNNSRTKRDDSKLDEIKIGNNKVDDKTGKKSQNPTKSKNLSKSKKTESGFLTSEAKRVFTKLRQAFIKAPILHHFNPEHHIQFETDVSGYAIGGVLSQLTSDDLSQ